MVGKSILRALARVWKDLSVLPHKLLWNEGVEQVLYSTAPSSRKEGYRENRRGRSREKKERIKYKDKRMS